MVSNLYAPFPASASIKINSVLECFSQHHISDLKLPYPNIFVVSTSHSLLVACHPYPSQIPDFLNSIQILSQDS
uniref:Uncharacterized protein n=1 Tax=Helianthus annuus TaxID=4232 RepID=A0A251SNZ4_HELAN